MFRKRKSREEVVSDQQSSKKKSHPDPFENIPDETLQLILSNPDDKELCTTSRVSHRFNNVSSDIFKRRLRNVPSKKSSPSDYSGTSKQEYFIRKKSFDDTIKDVLSLVFDTKAIRDEDGNLKSFDTTFHDKSTTSIDVGDEKTGAYTYDALMKVIDGFDPLVVLERVLQVIDNACKMNNETGQGLLHYFIGTIRYDVIERLLRAKVSPNDQNTLGETPIHVMFAVCCEARYAEAFCPSISLLQLLLSHSADFKINSNDYDEAENSIHQILGISDGYTLSGACLRSLAFLYNKNAFSDSEESFMTKLPKQNLDQYLIEREKIIVENVEDSPRLGMM